MYRYKRQNKCFKQGLGDGVILILMKIPPGEFLMGAPETAPESFDSQRPQHRVRLEPFFMGCYPVTQAQWRVVANYPQVERDLDPNPSRFTGENRPVENVSWDYATEFCKRLSAKTGREYCLPSEAEWEYACRSGMETPFHFGETITTELANYNGNYPFNDNEGSQGEYRKTTTEVGSFPANEWGLHDMHGNVWEWCEDDWHDNYEGAPNDGTAWIEENRTGTGRVFRGGSYFSNPGHCSSAFRDNGTRITLINDMGFRVVCHLPFP
ncbi:formylglycine-generating enzyme family protein [Laspinema palackyanum]